MVGKKAGGNEEQRRAAAREVGQEGATPSAQTFTGRGTSEYTAEHEQVFAALTDAQQANGGEAVYLDELARRSGQDRERTRALLHDLTEVYHLVTQLRHADRGLCFEVKPGSSR